MTKSWEREKERMFEMYMRRGMRLADLQRIMAEQYGFEASERSYKQKFREWKWFKKTPRAGTSAAEEVSPNESDYIFAEQPRASSSSRRHHDPQMYDEVAATYDNYPEVTYEQVYAAPLVSAPPAVGFTQWGSMDPMGSGLSPAPQTSAWAQSKSTFKHYLRDAEQRVDLNQFDLAQRALHEALRQLEWMRDTAMIQNPL